jgi:hypothetical protein
VLVLVLVHFINNLCHTSNVFFVELDSFRPATSGGRFPLSCLLIRLRTSFMFDSAKVQHFLHVSKFSASNWGDFLHEFVQIDVFNIEPAHARQSSCEHGSALA